MWPRMLKGNIGGQGVMACQGGQGGSDQVSLKFALNMLQVYIKHASSMFQVCFKFASVMLKVYFKYVSSLL